MTRGHECGVDAQRGEVAQVGQQVAQARLPVLPQVEAVPGPAGATFHGAPAPTPKNMEAAGMLRREPHPSDRRLVRLRLTSRGRGLEQVIDDEMRQLTERALATLSTAEREALIGTLQQIRRNLSAG
jgi:hypothetical protein